VEYFDALTVTTFGHTVVEREVVVMSMITASIWVPRGAAANFPTRYDIDESELSRISKLAKLQLEDAQEDLEHARKEGPSQSSTDDSENEQPAVNLPQSQEYG